MTGDKREYVADIRGWIECWQCKESVRAVVVVGRFGINGMYTLTMYVLSWVGSYVV